MQKSIIAKGFVIGIIVLFIGVSVIPNVLAQVDNVSNAEDIVLTSKVYGSNGFKSKIVSVTQDQYNEIETLFDSIQKSIDEKTTTDELIVIFHDAVVTLDKYHLFPNEMGIKQVQKLVINGMQNSNNNKNLKNFIQRKTLDKDSYDNVLCLTVGRTDETIFVGGPMVMGLIILMRYLSNNFGMPVFYNLATLLGVLSGFNPLPLLHFVNIGDHSGRPIIPANGWLATVGLKGVKTWNDHLYGTFNDLGPLLGIIGFTGFHLYNPIGKHFYLGSSLLVKVTEY